MPFLTEAASQVPQSMSNDNCRETDSIIYSTVPSSHTIAEERYKRSASSAAKPPLPGPGRPIPILQSRGGAKKDYAAKNGKEERERKAHLTPGAQQQQRGHSHSAVTSAPSPIPTLINGAYSSDSRRDSFEMDQGGHLEVAPTDEVAPKEGTTKQRRQGRERVEIQAMKSQEQMPTTCCATENSKKRREPASVNSSLPFSESASSYP